MALSTYTKEQLTIAKQTLKEQYEYFLLRKYMAPKESLLLMNVRVEFKTVFKRDYFQVKIYWKTKNDENHIKEFYLSYTHLEKVIKEGWKFPTVKF